MERIARIARYTVVVGGLWVAEIIVFAALHNIIGVTASIVLTRTLGGPSALFLHKRFSFRQTGRLRSREAVEYAALWAIKLSLSVFGVAGALATIGGHPVAVKIAVDIAVFALSFLVLSRIFVPREASGQSSL